MQTPDSPAPIATRRRVDRLLEKQRERARRSIQLAKIFEKLNHQLAIGTHVTAALQQLSDQLFKQLLAIVEEKLTIALQEILDQPITFHADADFRRGAATVDFCIKRDGHEEDILRGQGGSVANILSVGLRLFALTTLDPTEHRRFLVLDEQDCWLRPDLVPRLVKIVHDAGKALGFQVIMVSHHDVSTFAPFADKIYEFAPSPDGVQVTERAPDPGCRDVE